MSFDCGEGGQGAGNAVPAPCPFLKRGGDTVHATAVGMLRRQKGVAMYALIYDEHRLERPQKRVISVHDSRKNAELALEDRKVALGRKVWDCHTRIVWVEKRIAAGESIGPEEYATWRPGEPIPEGELHSDSD